MPTDENRESESLPDTTEAGAAEKDAAGEDVFVELPAPGGWKKKFVPKTSGALRKNEIVFISPTGEEMKNKRQVDQYLKSHPGGPLSSEFDWSSGDTPRRSARISERAKAIMLIPGEEIPRKRARRSASKKGSAEKKDITDGKEKTMEETAPSEEKKESDDAEMKDVEQETGMQGEPSSGKAAVEAAELKEKIETCEGTKKINKSSEDTKPAEAGEEVASPVSDYGENKAQSEKISEEAKEKGEEEIKPEVEDKEKEDKTEKTSTITKKNPIPAETEAKNGEFSADNGSHQDNHEHAAHEDISIDDNKHKEAGAEPKDADVKEVNRECTPTQPKASPVEC